MGVKGESVKREAATEAPGALRLLQHLGVPKPGGEGETGQPASEDADHATPDAPSIFTPSESGRHQRAVHVLELAGAPADGVA